MEEEDSYYYHHPVSLVLRFLETNAAISQSSCLQKRLFQEFCGQTSIIQQLNSLANYQNYQHIERVKPLVPGFEDPYKKVKSEYKDDSTNSELKTEESISTSSDSITLKTESLTFQDHVHPQEIVTQNDFFRATIKQEDVKIEETHDETPLEVDDFPECSTAPTYKDWNKKDLKKLNKFLSLCKTYQEKLAIDNLLVFEKFQQIATLVIPQLLTHFKSKPFEAVSAAILLYACREVKYPVTLKQIVSISDSKEKLINKCVFSIKEIFPLNAEVKHFKAGEFIHVLAEKLKLGDSVRAAAVKMFENIEKLGLMKSIHAMTLAACCVKIACSLSNSEQDLDSLAVAAGTTKTTLRNMYRKLFPHRFRFITKDCKLSDPKDLKDL